MSDTIEVFISYSKQDKALRDGLLAHLDVLRGEGIITWHDRQILPGTQWDEEIKARLNAADIILLLISATFLNTDYCKQVEIPEALRRHAAGEATVMPVILRSCGWKYTPLKDIHAYPEKAKPIETWTYINEAYTDVVDAVYLAATEIKKRRKQRQQALAPQNQSSDTDDLSSDRHIDYTRLRDLLKAGEWGEADQETAEKMCEVMGRQKEGWLQERDIEQFPCTDLRTIDRLWVIYSDGKFGFSVQKQIWQECGSPMDYNPDWNEFCDRVGWRVKGERIAYFDVTLNTSANSGHLPVVDWWWLGDLDDGWLHGGWLFSPWSLLAREDL